MRLFYLSSIPVGHLFLVMVWGSIVRGQLCPQGQIAHVDRDVPSGIVKCCLPITDCAPNHYLTYCEKNGTEDTCESCPTSFGLFKRTSSFAVEPCHTLRVETLVESKKCKPKAEYNQSEAQGDVENCYCSLEEGYYYHSPQVALGPSSYCQPFRDMCRPGFQPNQKGRCEPCPPNTVQNETSFRLCRPQKNCTALRLEVKSAGTAEKETECAELPPPVVNPTSPIDKTSTSPVSRSTKPTTTLDPDGSVRPTIGRTSEGGASLIVVVAVVFFLVLVCLGLFFFGHRKGWYTCIWKGKCHHQDEEGHTGPGNQMPMSGQDNDNSSDNSCYTCADSCLTSSNKNNSTTAGKPVTNATDQSKAQRQLPMLEAYMNRNPNQSMTSNGSSTEPFYNSISQDEQYKLNNGHMPSYKNTNGYLPSERKEDLHFYPNEVHLPSSDEDNSLDKQCYAAVRQRGMREGRDRDDFTETDPLLSTSENYSSGVPTPVSTPALRGILRNGNNRQNQPRGGPVIEGNTPGNRPHLSMLLNSGPEASNVESQAENLPHLSQLVSSQHSPPAPGNQVLPQRQHQQLLQQHAPQPDQQGHDFVHRPQQDSPVAARLIPVSSAAHQSQLNPSLVQMEELKPVMPLCLNPSPVDDTAPEFVKVASGAKPINRDQEYAGSPARISPSQQQEVRGNGITEALNQRPAGNHSAVAASPSAADHRKREGKAKSVAQNAGKATKADSDEVCKGEKEINEETFQKQAVQPASPCGDDTMQKSVCASSGLGDSLDMSSALDLPSEDEGRSRTMYRRSNSEASRSVSPPHQLPPSRSISSPEEKHRPFAVVKPMQSDQSLNAMSGSQDRLSELTQQFDAAGRQFPLSSFYGHPPRRQSSRESSDDAEQTRPKTPDNLSEHEEDEHEEDDRHEERTQVLFSGDNDKEKDTHRKDTGQED